MQTKLSKRKLGLSEVETNVSEDRNKLYLPENDVEWENLLQKVLQAFIACFNDTVRKIKDKEFQKKMMNGAHLPRCAGLDNTSPLYSSNYMYSDPLYYKIRILQYLLQHGSVSKDDIQGEIEGDLQSRRHSFDKHTLAHAWYQIIDLIAFSEEAMYNDGYYEICKVGKPIIRALLANDYPYPSPPRKGIAHKYGRESDYSRWYFGKGFVDES